MTRLSFSTPPRALKRVRCDNVALVPGSMLPYMEACQASANRLPNGAVLIVLPEKNEAQKHTMLLVAKLLSLEGHQVAVIPAAELRRQRKG